MGKLDRFILVNGDTRVPIYQFFDEWGLEVDDLEAAFSFTAGPTRDGHWVHGRVDEFLIPTLQ